MVSNDFLDAGGFLKWLSHIRAGGPTDVPCGDCHACCRSSYFIHITATESDTLAHVPAPLRFSAPGQPPGTQVMGYDRAGACPMLQHGRCTIYPHRPGTCRDYDCRIFAATGIAAGGADKRAVTAQVARWRFSYPTENDLRHQRAVRRAAEFVRTRRDSFDPGVLPDNPTQTALLVLNVYPVFLQEPLDDDAAAAAVNEIIARRQS